MSILNFDLNLVATEAINEEISGLKKDIYNLTQANQNHKNTIAELRKTMQSNESVDAFVAFLRKAFSEIKASEPDKSGWYDSKQKNQYNFICQLMLLIFGIKQEHGGWQCSRSDGGLPQHLAINYYKSKEEICLILKVLDYMGPISFIQDFRMPYDWTMDVILKFVDYPPSNTNGAYFGVSNFWIESGANFTNAPHDLVMQSKYMVDPDMFDKVIVTIKREAGRWTHLYKLPLYNSWISKEQIQQLGATLITGLHISKWDEAIKLFVDKFIKDFDKSTMDFLTHYAQNHNQFSALHWQAFPAEYQVHFLRKMSISNAVKALNSNDCKLNDEEKAAVLKELLA